MQCASAPCLGLNLYIFDYVNCSTRSYFFPYLFGVIYQQAITVFAIVYAIVICVVQCTLQANASEEQKQRSAKKSFVAQDGSDIQHCLLLLLKCTKIAGMIMVFAGVLLQVIVLFVQDTQEIEFLAIMKVIHYTALILFVIFYDRLFYYVS